MTRAALGVMLLGLSAASLGFQFASGVHLVEVYATVTDEAGAPVLGLTAGDFEVYENGERQEVAAFTSGEFPLAVAIAIDRSWSMARDRLPLARAAGEAFLRELRPSDLSMIIAIGTETEVLAPLSADRAAQQEVLRRLDPWGTTGLHDAIIASLDFIQPAGGRRALVILSDGDDRFSHASALDALERARRADVLIYPVAFGRSRPPLFVELAVLSGGRSHHLQDGRSLADVFRTIALELRHQYLLGYTPGRSFADDAGEWRQIDVRVGRPGTRVRARDGYYAGSRQ